jgi:hypothetical protein
MGKVSTAWKNLEKSAAEKLGGKRLVRGDDFSQTLLDVEHPIFAIDCKWRSSLAVARWYEKLLVDNKKIYPKENKVPILVLKERGMRGELIVISLEDFLSILNDDIKEAIDANRSIKST